MNKDFEQKLIELRKGYIKKLKDLPSSFIDLSHEEPININEIYLKVHTISGTSGMYGLSDLSNASTEFEIYLKGSLFSSLFTLFIYLSIKPYTSFLNCIFTILELNYILL